MAFFGTGGTGADLPAPVEAPQYRPYERACGTEKPRYKIVAVVTALFGTLVLAVWTRLVFLRFGCRRVKRGLLCGGKCAAAEETGAPYAPGRFAARIPTKRCVHAHSSC